MRTPGHREGNNIHRPGWGSGGEGRGETMVGGQGGWEGITPGEMPEVGDRSGVGDGDSKPWYVCAYAT